MRANHPDYSDTPSARADDAFVVLQLVKEAVDVAAQVAAFAMTKKDVSLASQLVHATVSHYAEKITASDGNIGNFQRCYAEYPEFLLDVLADWEGTERDNASLKETLEEALSDAKARAVAIVEAEGFEAE